MAPRQNDHDEHFDIKWDALQGPAGDQDTAPPAPRDDKPRGALPVEKTPPAEIEDVTSVLHELLDFHYYGARKDAAESPAAFLPSEMSFKQRARS